MTITATKINLIVPSLIKSLLHLLIPLFYFSILPEYGSRAEVTLDPNGNHGGGMLGMSNDDPVVGSKL